MLFFLEARIWEKCSAAERISRLASPTSSLRPVTTNTGSSPRTGVLMYVFVFARSALILHPEIKEKLEKIKSGKEGVKVYKIENLNQVYNTLNFFYTIAIFITVNVSVVQIFYELIIIYIYRMLEL